MSRKSVIICLYSDFPWSFIYDICLLSFDLYKSFYFILDIFPSDKIGKSALIQRGSGGKRDSTT